MVCTLLFALAATQEAASEYLALCVGSSLVVACCSSTTAAQLIWILIPNMPVGPNSTLEVTYNDESSLEDVKMIGDFVVRLESKNPLVSTATLDEVDSKHNGTGLICRTVTSQGSEEFTQTTILIVKDNWLGKQHATAMTYFQQSK